MRREWEKVTLGDVATIQTGVAKNEGYSGETIEIPYLRVANVQDGFLDLSEIKKIKIPVEKKNRFLLQKGDVIMTEGGDFDKLGRGTIWDGQITPCAHQNHLFVVRTDCTKLNPYFLSYLSASSYGRLYFRLSSKQSTNLASINSTQLSLFPILLPTLEEQKRIVDTISIWDSTIEKTEKLIFEKEKMFNGISQKIFRKASIKHKISEFLTIRNEKCIPDDSTPLYSLTIENGITPKSDRYDREALVKDSEEKEYKVVYPGDIVFNPANLRWGAIARSNETKKVAVSPIYEVLQLDSSKINSDYLTFLLTSKDKIRYYATKTEGTLVERMAVKVDAFLNFQIEIEEKYEKQKASAEVLTVLKKEISLLRKQLEQHKLQKQGLMQKLLTGEWRVK